MKFLLQLQQTSKVGTVTVEYTNSCGADAIVSMKSRVAKWISMY